MENPKFSNFLDLADPMDDDLTTPLLNSNNSTKSSTLRFRRTSMRIVQSSCSSSSSDGNVLRVVDGDRERDFGRDVDDQFKYSEMSPGRLLAVSLAYGFGYASVLYTCRKLSMPYLRSKVAAQRGTSHYLLKFPVGHCNPL